MRPGAEVRAPTAARAGELLTVHVQTVDVLNLHTSALSEIERGGYQLVAALYHVPPPTVQSRIDQNRGTGGAEQIGARLEHGWVDQIALLVKY